MSSQLTHSLSSKLRKMSSRARARVHPVVGRNYSYPTLFRYPSGSPPGRRDRDVECRRLISEASLELNRTAAAGAPPAITIINGTYTVKFRNWPSSFLRILPRARPSSRALASESARTRSIDVERAPTVGASELRDRDRRVSRFQEG